MPNPRSRELTDRLDQLRGWALREALTVWRGVDPDHILASFTAAAPALIGIHHALCIEALTAVDLHMYCVAADAGVNTDPDWTVDAPARPDHTYAGETADVAIRRTPVIVLWRIKTGDTVEAAMLRGWHTLARLYGTEAHHIARTLIAARVRTDLARRGL